MMKVSIMDKDKGSDDIVGEALISLKDYILSQQKT